MPATHLLPPMHTVDLQKLNQIVPDNVLNKQKHFEKFRQWNGNQMTYDMFEHATEMNNRADELANIAMDELRR